MIFYSTKLTYSQGNRTPFRSAIAQIQGCFPGAIAEIFSSCGASQNTGFSLNKSFHLSLLSGKSPTFSFSEAPKKSHLRDRSYSRTQIQEFFPRAIAEKFSSCGASQNTGFSPIESFHPPLLSGKSPTFSFSRATGKKSRLKGFLPAS